MVIIIIMDFVSPQNVPESRLAALHCDLSIYHIYGDYCYVIFNSDPGTDITPPITLISPQKIDVLMYAGGFQEQLRGVAFRLKATIRIKGLDQSQIFFFFFFLRRVSNLSSCSTTSPTLLHSL